MQRNRSSTTRGVGATALAVITAWLLVMACATVHATPGELPHNIPKTVSTPLGPLAVQIIPGLRCNNLEALGCFNGDQRYFAIRDSMPTEVTWAAYEHEWVHAAFYYARIRFASSEQEDRIAEAIANARLMERRYPR